MPRQQPAPAVRETLITCRRPLAEHLALRLCSSLQAMLWPDRATPLISSHSTQQASPQQVRLLQMVPTHARAARRVLHLRTVPALAAQTIAAGQMLQNRGRHPLHLSLCGLACSRTQQSPSSFRCDRRALVSLPLAQLRLQTPVLRSSSSSSRCRSSLLQAQASPSQQLSL